MHTGNVFKSKKLKITQIANGRIDRLIMVYLHNIPFNNENK